MDLLALGVVAALVALTTVAGLLLRAGSGRLRTARRADAVDLAALGVDRGGERATLLQFSTAACAQCRPTARLLAEVAASTPGVRHAEVRLDDRPELADRFRVLQTPTTLLLDRDAVVRARIGGAPRPQELRRTLDDLLEAPA